MMYDQHFLCWEALVELVFWVIDSQNMLESKQIQAYSFFHIEISFLCLTYQFSIFSEKKKISIKLIQNFWQLNLFAKEQSFFSVIFLSQEKIVELIKRDRDDLPPIIKQIGESRFWHFVWWFSYCLCYSSLMHIA